MTTTDDERASNDEALGLELGITCEAVMVYRYKAHVYQNLSDALKYAKIDSLRANPDPEPPKAIKSL